MYSQLHFYDAVHAYITWTDSGLFTCITSVSACVHTESLPLSHNAEHLPNYNVYAVYTLICQQVRLILTEHTHTTLCLPISVDLPWYMWTRSRKLPSEAPGNTLSSSKIQSSPRRSVLRSTDIPRRCDEGDRGRGRRDRGEEGERGEQCRRG